MVRTLSVTAALAAALVLGRPALADENDSKPVDDKTFLMKALAAGHAEVKLGELAQKHASNEKVKEFAQRMVQDHSKANQQLAEHARNQKLAVVSGLEKDHRDHHDMMSKLQGADFDKAYMQHMVKGHEKAVKLFEGQAKNGTDPELKKFAEMTLPTIREHLAQAKALNDTVKGGGDK